jgi:guanylate kinase
MQCSLLHFVQVIKSGKLPLIELEAEGTAALKAKGIDSLAVFLQPTSTEEFKDRLLASLKEAEEEVEARMQAAAAQVSACSYNQGRRQLRTVMHMHMKHV